MPLWSTFVHVFLMYYDYLLTVPVSRSGSEKWPISQFLWTWNFCSVKFLTQKSEHFLSGKTSLNGICTGAGAGKHNVLHAHCTDIEGVKTVRPFFFYISRCYMNCSATRKSKIVCARSWKFYSVCGVKICSVNLDRENNFLTLILVPTALRK